jgi:alcohol dehydrogenase
VLKSVDAAPLSSHSTQGGHGVDVLHHSSPEGGSVFFMPTLSYMGRGALESSGAKMKSLGLSKALVVTDAVLNKVGAVAALTDVLSKIGIRFVVFDGVEPNPTVEQVHEGVEIFKKEKCDFVIR